MNEKNNNCNTIHFTVYTVSVDLTLWITLKSMYSHENKQN